MSQNAKNKTKPWFEKIPNGTSKQRLDGGGDKNTGRKK